jgi:hypothetical protein
MTKLYNNIPLPSGQFTSSSDGTITFFDNYYKVPIQINTTDLTAMTGYFESKGYGIDAAKSVATIILTQAKKDGLNPFDIIGTLKTFNGLQLSALVGEILNNNRFKSSNLGIASQPTPADEVIRNIVA